MRHIIYHINIAILLAIGLLPLIYGCSANQSRQVPSATTESVADDWIHLFNGQDLDDWIAKIHHYEPGDNFGKTFRVEDGMIKVRYDDYGEDFDDRFGHLFYKTPFSHYHLIVEYRFTGSLFPGAPDYTLLNSGVMFHSQDPYSILKEQNWPISIELQFLAGLGDGKSRATGNMCSPGTHVYYRDKLMEDHIIESSAATYDKDDWVRAELIVLGDSLITHIIEGDTVLQYTKPQIGGGVVERFDPNVKIDGTPLKEGYIALQSEGQPIDFRRVDLKLLNQD